ncbi:MAG TPA: MltA domain-containing protein, partial [Rhizobacter sp.]
MMTIPFRLRPYVAAAILGVLAACVSAPPSPPPAPLPPVADKPAPAAPAVVMQRTRSRWVQADWSDLPGWEADTLMEWWPALQRGCDRPPPEWARLCADARSAAPASDASARAWLRQRLQPWRVESHEAAPDGLVTGYFEPLVEARRVAGGNFRIPLHSAPADLATRKPYWTRQQIATQPAAQAALRGTAIAYVADPLDAL